MGWWQRQRQNWADTSPPSHPDLAPVDLPDPISAALPAVIHIISAMPRWRVEAQDDATRTIRATHRTRLWGFTDDITIRLEETPTGTRVHARSQSRIGKGDLGQNRRNLIELLTAVKARWRKDS